MLRSAIAVLLVICPVFVSIAQTAAPPLCPEGKWPVRSSRDPSGWQCTNQTTSGDQSTNSGASSGRRRHGMGSGGFGSGGYGSPGQ